MKSESVCAVTATVCLFTTKMLAKPQSKKLAGPRLLKKYELRNVFYCLWRDKVLKKSPSANITSYSSSRIETYTHSHKTTDSFSHTISTSLWTKEGMRNDFPFLNLMHWNVFIEQKAWMNWLKFSSISDNNSESCDFGIPEFPSFSTTNRGNPF